MGYFSVVKYAPRVLERPTDLTLLAPRVLELPTNLPLALRVAPPMNLPLLARSP